MSSSQSQFDRIPLNATFLIGIYALQTLAFFMMSPGFLFSMISQKINGCPEKTQPSWIGHLGHSFLAATLSTVFIVLALKTDMFKDRRAALLRSNRYQQGGGGYY